MRIVILIAVACTALSGCASRVEREREAERRGFERGYGQAAKEFYWQMQQAQRAKPTTP